MAHAIDCDMDLDCSCGASAREEPLLAAGPPPEEHKVFAASLEEHAVSALLKADAVDRARPSADRTTSRLSRSVRRYMLALRNKVLASLRDKPAGPSRGISKGRREDLLARIASAMEEERGGAGWFRSSLTGELGAHAQEAARLSLAALADDYERMLSQVNEDAVAWAALRAGELIRQVEETLLGEIRDIVALALEEGATNDDIAERVGRASGFAPARATTIARTETAFADNAGTLIAWDASGEVEGKEWLVADSRVCPLCTPMDGVRVELDGTFTAQDGTEVDGPPLHPNCRCTLLPVLLDEEKKE